MNNKGLTLLELMIVVAIIGILTALAIPNYQNFQKRSLQKGAMAHLLGYRRSAKIVIGEFGFNPGNFPAIGYRPEGDIHYRIAAADNSTGWNVPLYFNDSSCVDTGDLCNTPSGFSRWSETSNNFWENKTPVVNNLDFKVYAFPPNSASNDPNDILCVNEGDEVFFEDCP